MTLCYEIFCHVSFLEELKEMKMSALLTIYHVCCTLDWYIYIYYISEIVFQLLCKHFPFLVVKSTQNTEV